MRRLIGRTFTEQSQRIFHGLKCHFRASFRNEMSRFATNSTVTVEVLVPEKSAAGSWGRAGRANPVWGRGGGDVTGVATRSDHRAVAVAGAARGSPSAIHTFGSACDCRLTKR